jgi:hypothetical protein
MEKLSFITILAVPCLLRANGYCLCGDEPNVFGRVGELACQQRCDDEPQYAEQFPLFTCGGIGVVSVYYS